MCSTGCANSTSCWPPWRMVTSYPRSRSPLTVYGPDGPVPPVTIEREGAGCAAYSQSERCLAIRLEWLVRLGGGPHSSVDLQETRPMICSQIRRANGRNRERARPDSCQGDSRRRRAERNNAPRRIPRQRIADLAVRAQGFVAERSTGLVATKVSGPGVGSPASGLRPRLARSGLPPRSGGLGPALPAGFGARGRAGGGCADAGRAGRGRLARCCGGHAGGGRLAR